MIPLAATSKVNAHDESRTTGLRNETEKVYIVLTLLRFGKLYKQPYKLEQPSVLWKKMFSCYFREHMV